MAKMHSDSLFNLIKSLSKSEKRAFKLYANRIEGEDEKKIICIFNRIDKQKVYNEKKILAKEKQLRRIQMPNLKAHLQLQIMKCLAASSQRNAEMKVTSLMDYARILYNKCLYYDALKMIEKAKRAALENDTKVLLLEILELEKLALRHTIHEGNESRINTIISETENTARSIQNINIFSNLSLKLNLHYQHIGFIRNNSDYKQAKDFFENSLPAYNESKLSFHEKLYLYYSYTGYYYFIQDFKNGFAYALRLVELFQSQPEMIYRKQELYIRALNNLLVAYNKLNRYDAFYFIHKTLIALKRDPKFIKTENINLNLFKTIYIHEINRHFMLGEFTSGTRIVRGLEHELTNFLPRLDKHTVLILFYKIACLYFGASNFKMAIKWLNHIVNEKEIELREDLHSFARIIRLISYFEIDDQDLVEYGIKSTYRFLLKKGTLQHYHELILQFLRNAKNYDTSKKLLCAFSELKKQMEKLKDSTYEKRAFLYFDIISWLESRIESQSVEEIIKEKVKKRGINKKLNPQKQ